MTSQHGQLDNHVRSIDFFDSVRVRWSACAKDLLVGARHTGLELDRPLPLRVQFDPGVVV
jgi:hypothetical protein